MFSPLSKTRPLCLSKRNLVVTCDVSITIHFCSDSFDYYCEARSLDLYMTQSRFNQLAPASVLEMITEQCIGRGAALARLGLHVALATKVTRRSCASVILTRCSNHLRRERVAQNERIACYLQSADTLITVTEEIVRPVHRRREGIYATRVVERLHTALLHTLAAKFEEVMRDVELRAWHGWGRVRYKVRRAFCGGDTRKELAKVAHVTSYSRESIRLDEDKR